MGKDVAYTLVDQEFGYVRVTAPLIDLAGISTQFCGAISIHFCFELFDRGVSAMPRRLHARLRHAFLV